MRDVFTTYAAPCRSAHVTGTVMRDVPEPTSPIQTVWCEGLPVVRVARCADGFMALYLVALEHMPLYVRVRDIPQWARLLISPAEPRDAFGATDP